MGIGIKVTDHLYGRTIAEIAEADYEHAKDIIEDLIEQKKEIKRKAALVDECLEGEEG